MVNKTVKRELGNRATARMRNCSFQRDVRQHDPLHYFIKSPLIVCSRPAWRRIKHYNMIVLNVCIRKSPVGTIINRKQALLVVLLQFFSDPGGMFIAKIRDSLL